MNRKRRYSASKLETYNQCPRKYFYQSVYKLPSLPSPILERGTLFHAYLEADLKEEALSIGRGQYKVLTPSDIEDVIKEAHTFASSSRFYHSLKSLPGKKVEGRISMNQNLEPCSNEDPNVLLNGYIDLHADESGDLISIYDWKTGGKDIKTLRKYPKSKLQLYIYGIWAIQQYEEKNRARLGYVYVDHDYPVVYTLMKETLLNPIKKEIINNIDKIEEDTNFIRKPTKLCGWCDHRERCKTEDSIDNLISELEQKAMEGNLVTT